MAKLPAYEMVIDENAESEVEVSFIALVDKPAIEKNFMAFNSVRLDFAIDTARQIISGPAMVPDTLIYRRDAGGEYNVFFSKDTIESIALKFFKKDYQKNLNLFHDPALSLQGVTIFESFVSDKARGIQPMKGFEDLPDGTWFISAKVENPQVWAKVQTGEVKGFSVEGIFSYMKKPTPKPIEEEMAEVLTRTYNANGHIPQKDFMSKIKDMVDAFKKQFFDGTPLVAPPPAPAPAPAVTPQLLNTDYQLKDGTAVTVDKLEVGGTVLIAGMPAPAGEHELADGTKLTVGEGGLITLVTPVVAAVQTPAQQMAALQAAVTKFATGTPEERVSNLEIVAKALMEYSFGWQIREQQQKSIVDSAIEIYKTKFESAETKIKEYDQKLQTAEAKLTKQQETIAGLFGLIEQLAETPTANPVIENKLSFSKEKEKNREDRINALVQNIKKLKTA